MKAPVLVDIETDGQSPFVGDLLLIGACLIGEPVTVFECEPDRSMDTCWMGPGLTLQDLLVDPERPVISMTKYDPRYLRLQGWVVEGPFYDLQVMAWVMNENQPLNLDALVQRYCRVKMDKRLRRSAGEVLFKCDDGREVNLKVVRDDAVAWPQFVAYCQRDVESEAELFQTLMERLEETTWLDFYLEECVPFTEVLLDMECAGLPVNLQDSEALREELEVKVVELRERLIANGGLPASFNLGSRKQMAAYLYHPVAELTESLEYDVETLECLKSCVAGEHEDCDTWEPGSMMDRQDNNRHVVDLLPVGFTVDKLGRTQVHGRWTFKGRRLPATELAPKCRDKECDHESVAQCDKSVSSPTLKSNFAAAQDPWVQELFEYRRYEKALTTYLRKYPVLAHGERCTACMDYVHPSPGCRSCGGTGVVNTRLYGRFNQTGTKTGRLSSSEPNLQNQPSHGELGERMRGLFQGNLIVGDYSQLEPRLMAHFSGDERLLSVYREGRDVYLDLAHGIFGPHVTKEDDERGICKTLVLAMGYGAGPAKVGQILTINGFPTDEYTAKGYLNELQQYYHRFFAWREAVIRRVKQRGYVTTLSGRHRRLKAAFADRRNWKNVGYGERQAVNAIVQGSAGDIVAHAMRVWPATLDASTASSLRLLAQVHDELVWEHSIDAEPDGYEHSQYVLGQLKHAAEDLHGYELDCPLLFEPHFGSSWFAAKEGIELPDDLLEEATTGYEEDA